MQYKTIQVDHYRFTHKNQTMSIADVYENEINTMSSQGWKLLGIHTVDVNRDATGCWDAFWGKSKTSHIVVDVLVFFRD